ncbi:MAG: DUF111 family protein [Mogibacterium sp.]|nr:DUF111 family protein [Mogibacterium sp.]
MKTDRVCELECNIDDMTAEEISFAAERIMAAGAKDVTVTPVIMKKGRPAMMITVMCADEDEEKERFARLLFRYTSTIGIREVISERFVLDREILSAETPYGTVRYKHVSGFGTDRIKAEYDDLAGIASSKDCSIAEARSLVMPYILEDLKHGADR